MNIVVIGLGSMGKRRIRLIKELYPEYSIVGIDGRKDRRDNAAEQFYINTFMSIEELNTTIDCAFICTSPLSHASIIKECLQRKWHVFTELMQDIRKICSWLKRMAVPCSYRLLFSIGKKSNI